MCENDAPRRLTDEELRPLFRNSVEAMLLSYVDFRLEGDLLQDKEMWKFTRKLVNEIMKVVDFILDSASHDQLAMADDTAISAGYDPGLAFQHVNTFSQLSVRYYSAFWLLADRQAGLNWHDLERWLFLEVWHYQGVKPKVAFKAFVQANCNDETIEAVLGK